jgi:hypothetical protein
LISVGETVALATRRAAIKQIFDYSRSNSFSHFRGLLNKALETVVRTL